VPTKTPLIEVKNLKISFNTEFGKIEAVKDFSFDINEGETLALVGESGSGKSVCAYCLTGLLNSSGAVFENGTIKYMGEPLPLKNDFALRKLRGKNISYIFQEPMVSLNPLHNIEKQITERLTRIEKVNKSDARKLAIDTLRMVGINNPGKRLNDLPHAFSGGERQRIMIAAAIISKPNLLIADEPTTALDVTVQKQILELIAFLKAELNMAVLLISHDLGVVRNYADRTVVVRIGKVIETGVTSELFANPQNDYTKLLIGSKSEKAADIEGGEVILDVKNLSVAYKKPATFLSKESENSAVKGVSFSLKKGLSLGIVGESGSGKTSIIKAILHLIPFSGDVEFLSEPFSGISAAALRSKRKKLQVVFQDPYGSLNPRMSAESIVTEGLRAQGITDKSVLNTELSKALEAVGLSHISKGRYPHEFSGGERQRLAIARAIIMRPELIIFDEPTSSLDRTVQFQIVAILKNLQTTLNTTFIFVSHDLRLVRSICQEIIVIKDGVIVENGRTETVLSNPQNEYTKILFESIV
jgi:ABC-type microcin C transport system duplicated ATPase subunit YejF